MPKSSVPNMKVRRLELGMVQKDLASHLSTTQKVISDYESGNSSPRADVLVQLASVLRTSTDYLCGLTNNSQPSNEEWSDEVVRVARFMMTLSPARQLFVERMVYAVIASTQAFQDDELPPN